MEVFYAVMIRIVGTDKFTLGSAHKFTYSICVMAP